MRVAVIGAGNMGSWLVEALCLEHEVGVYDTDRNKLKYFFNSRKFLYLEDLLEYEPDILVNAVSLEKTVNVFTEVVPFLPENCMISDITSVKNILPDYYKNCGKRFVSTHPMFGPTFANIRDLKNEHAIIIKESDEEGKQFFRDFYSSLGLNIHEYTFKEHDETIAYSLSIPFSSTLVFGSCMREQKAPGTTFRKHFEIAKGLMSENDFLLAEILLNPYSLEQIQKISQSLNHLLAMIQEKDMEGLQAFFMKVRKNIGVLR